MQDLSKLSLADLEALDGAVRNELRARRSIRANIRPRAVLTGNHIADVRAYREKHGVSLMEARDAVLLAEGRL